MTISEKTKEFQRQVSSALTHLLEIKLAEDAETKELLEFLAISVSNNGGDHGRKIFLNKTLECINEPETFYYENDAFIRDVNQNRGRRIYSPRIDLCISPSFRREGERKGRCFMNILLPIGSRETIFGSLQRNIFVETLRNMINSKSEENYRRVSHIDRFELRNIQEVNNALYLFGIEIENNPNKKHLMGDFLNAYMLSLNPIVLVPEKKLETTLGLIEFLYTIKELKGIDFTSLLKVNLLTIKQFKEIVNSQLIENNMQPIDVADYE